MRTGRRQFLGGLFAAGMLPRQTWADAGAPAYLSAAALPSGDYVLCGITDALNISFDLALPARGHAAAAHPSQPVAVAFARRPGNFAIVLDCVTGHTKAVLHAPDERHFYGHGTFSQNGDLLFTTENDYEAGRGLVGVWDVTRGYKRIGEFSSGGVGPHDIKRLPKSDTLVVANGGIDTHPDSGRTKLNIPTMQSNLSYIENGTVVETAGLPEDMQKNSIRHLSLDANGTVAFGMQWQGDGPVAALVGKHRRGAALKLAQTSLGNVARLKGYVGSVAYSADGQTIAATSPRGSVLHFYDADQMTLTNNVGIADVCGAAPRADGFLVTAGTGDIGNPTEALRQLAPTKGHQWDNHLVTI